MRTLPCHGCGCKADPNCIEDCVSHNVWAKEHYRKFYRELFDEEKAQNSNFITDSERYYEPCDETGEPYRKGSLDEKFKRYRQ